MNERTIRAVNILLLLSSTLTIYGLMYYVLEDHTKTREQFTPKDFGSAPRHEWWNDLEPIKEPIELEAVNEVYELQDTIRGLDIHYKTIKTKYLGKYFVTAYCPEECGGSWKTSSGATCHYSEDPLEATTCAIDRSIHGYNEILMIEGKLYRTEDTGPGVKGYWIDCFVETMSEVHAWDTGYKSVYSVSYENHLVTGKERKERHELIKHSLLYRINGSRNDYRLGY